MKIAVIGRGSAGSLAAAGAAQRFPESELWHVYDPRTPVIGVGEGTLPGLVTQLQQYTGLEETAVQRRLNATRKYGINFEGWGRAHPGFTHLFHHDPYGYHLSTDTLVELLAESSRARQVDARVTRVARMDNGAELEFDRLPPERFDLVFDARGFPRRLDPEQHVVLPFIPTNAAVIRRTPPRPDIDPDRAFTRAVARPHGWIFVIPLTVHTSWGYVFNRHVSDTDDVESDFDAFLEEQDVPDFEPRGTIPFPNFIHRRIFDGRVARIGNAAGFMEPLEATALGLIQIQIDAILDFGLTMPPDRLSALLARLAWGFGVFVAWHYSEGSVHDTAFWRYARDEAWPRHRDPVAGTLIDSGQQARQLARRVGLAMELAPDRLLARDVELAIGLQPLGPFFMPNFVDMVVGLGLDGLPAGGR